MGKLKMLFAALVALLALAACDLLGGGLHTLSFDPNAEGCSGSTPAIEGEEGQTVTIPACGFTRPGWDFDGWTRSSGSTIADYQPGEAYTFGSSDETLYAIWIEDAGDGTFLLSFDINGGTGTPPPAERHLPGAAVDLPDGTGMSYAGHAFKGWRNSPDGGDAWTPDQSLAMPETDVTLYAWWAVTGLSVTYAYEDATGGTVPTDPASYTEGDTVTVLANPGNLVKEGSGRVLGSWSTLPGGGGVVYSFGDTFAIGTAEVSLHPVWVTPPATYSVSYSFSGIANMPDSGNFPSDPKLYEAGESVVLLDPGDLAKDSYEFSGWRTEPGGLGSLLQPGDSFAMPERNLTFYVEWTHVDDGYRTVVYEGDGYSTGTPPASEEYLIGDTVTVAGNDGPEALVREGWIFSGWQTETTGVAGTYQPGQTFTMPGQNVYFHPSWRETFPVSYNLDPSPLSASVTGALPVDATRYLEGDMVTLLGNGGLPPLALTGHSWAGWSTDPDPENASRPVYQAGNQLEMSNPGMALYAVWEADVFTVSFQAGGATGTVPADIPVEYGDSFIFPGKGGLSKNQDGILMRFTGWKSADAGDTTLYQPGASKVNVTTDLSFIAQWSVIGGLGPAGGLVYHDKGDATGGWRYLEAGPEDLSHSYNGVTEYGFYWGDYGSGPANLIPDTFGKTIGTGLANTAAMAAATVDGLDAAADGEISQYITGDPGGGAATRALPSAARVVDGYSTGGFGDWFIPSKEELEAMEALHDLGLGGFSAEVWDRYLSSTQVLDADTDPPPEDPDLWYDEAFIMSIGSSTAYDAPKVWILRYPTDGSTYYYGIRVRPARRF